jgi:hypothetical protein
VCVCVCVILKMVNRLHLPFNLERNTCWKFQAILQREKREEKKFERNCFNLESVLSTFILRKTKIFSVF